MTATATAKIAFQGEPGAYGHQACREARPEMEPLPCRTFEDAIEAVRKGAADLGMIAVENSTYGRVADVHHLLPDSGLHIVDEAFVRVHINLLGPPGATLDSIRTATSHAVLLGQCRDFMRQHDIEGFVGADTAGSAKMIAETNDPTHGALASELAAELYGLRVLARHIEDHDRNTTRFLVMSREPNLTRRGKSGMMMAFVFQVRNIPAALYKAMGGFATNGVNMIKLESYMTDGAFTATQFYAEIEGHPEEPPTRRALDELGYFTSALKILGCYPASELRSGRRA